MTRRTARCACGRLALACDGDPMRISICCCRECQRRTGSAFGVGAYFPETAVTPVRGSAKTFTRSSDAGRRLTFSFCPDCGSTVHWTMELRPGIVGVAVGAFADPDFPAPEVAVWTQAKAAWAPLPGAIPEHEKAS
jgi:hypothetical protein